MTKPLTKRRVFEAMGWVERTPHRTVDGVKAEIQAYFDEHGKRPLSTTNAQWQNRHGWLRNHHNFTLHQLCNEMGLPGGSNLTRTVDGIRAEIQAHFDKNGERPMKGTSTEWGRRNGWLRHHHDSTIAKQVVLMVKEGRLPAVAVAGLSDTLFYDWATDQEIWAEIKVYFKEHGTRPTLENSPKWGTRDSWLRKHRRRSLNQICHEMGLPTIIRTQKGIKTKIQDYFDEHGERPIHTTSTEWCSRRTWLIRHHDSSLNQLCNEMGLPGGRNTTRSFEGVRAEIQAHLDEYGERPMKGTSPEWLRRDSWLRKNHGSSLAKQAALLEGRRAA